MAKKYSKISVPEPLWEELQSIVDEYPELGYRSASEAAADSIRRRIEEVREKRKWRRRVEDGAESK